MHKPFSESLNQHVRHLSPAMYTVRPDAPNTYQELVEAWNYGELIVSGEHCDQSIYGDPTVNIAFRAWHDSIHLYDGLTFSFEDEYWVAFAQCQQIKALGASQWDIDLLWADTFGQVCYFDKWGRFPDNQRAFVASWIFDGSEQALARRF